MVVARGPSPLTGNGAQGREGPVGVGTQAWVRMKGEFFRAALFLVLSQATWQATRGNSAALEPAPRTPHPTTGPSLPLWRAGAGSQAWSAPG